MTDRINSGYGQPNAGSPAEQKAARRQRDAARLHVENPAMERLLRWKESDDPRYGQLDSHTLMALGHYAAGKAAAEAEAAKEFNR